jgi:hypothetical protein
MVLAIAVSGVGLAQVRAMAPAVGEAVLCVANGPVTIYIDASGQPTSPPAHCVECALALTCCASTGNGAVAPPLSWLPRIQN